MARARRSLAAVVLGLLAAGAAIVVAWPVAALRAAGELVLRLSGVASRHVRAGRFELRYLEAGSGPPLVLVHGLGSDAANDWGRLMAPLARGYHVYAPDLPGFGRSERAPNADYSIPMQVEALGAFMDAVGVPRARVAGLSMGGWIAARLAGEHPERVERLVLVDAAGMRPDDRSPIQAEVLLPHDEAGVRRLVEAVRHKPPPLPGFVARDILKDRLREEWVVRRALESMRPGRDWLNGTLARATMPVLVIWGRQDVLIPLAYASPLAAEFAHARLAVLDGCGHVPMADCPLEFDRELLGFLGSSAP